MKYISHHRFRTLSLALPVLAALALFAAACQDSATMPDVVAPSLSSAASNSSPYTCFTSIATPGGQYRYGRVHLRFPKEALAQDGSTVRYRYHGYANGAELDRRADCTIPRSAAAVELMHRRFGVQDKQMKKEGGSLDGGITIMDTQIDGIVIKACQYGGEYPNCNPKPTVYQEEPAPPATECSTYCDPWSDDGGGGGGGDPADEQIADDQEWDCHTAPTCQLRPPTSPERDKAVAQAKLIRIEKDPFCGTLRTNALEMIDRLQVWDEKIWFGGKYLAGDLQWTATQPIIHLWAGEITTANIIHETMHGTYYDPGDRVPMYHDDTGNGGPLYGGRTIKQWEQFCTT